MQINNNIWHSMILIHYASVCSFYDLCTDDAAGTADLCTDDAAGTADLCTDDAAGTADLCTDDAAVTADLCIDDAAGTADLCTDDAAVTAEATIGLMRGIFHGSQTAMLRGICHSHQC